MEQVDSLHITVNDRNILVSGLLMLYKFPGLSQFGFIKTETFKAFFKKSVISPFDMKKLKDHIKTWDFLEAWLHFLPCLICTNLVCQTFKSSA